MGLKGEEEQNCNKTTQNTINFFHIWDFPPKLVFVGFESQLVDDIIQRLDAFRPRLNIRKGGRKLFYHREVTCKFIRLRELIKISKLLELNGFSEYALPNLETKILGLKLPNTGSQIIWDPILPIREDKALIRIIMHFMGDGHLDVSIGDTKSPSYSNSSSFLRSQFVDCLRTVFGDINDCVRENISKKDKQIVLSKLLGDLIQSFYPDAKFSQQDGNIPKRFFDLPFHLRVEAIRTFGDDDGSVGPFGVRFTSDCEQVLLQLRELIVGVAKDDWKLTEEEQSTVLASIGPVKLQKNWYFLNLGVVGMHWYHDRIGFTHPERKAELEFQLVSREQATKYDIFDIDIAVLTGLRNRMTIREVAEHWMIKEETILKSMRYYRKRGWVKKVGRRKLATIWQLIPKGERWLLEILKDYQLDDLKRDRILLDPTFRESLFTKLLGTYGMGAEIARRVHRHPNTIRGYLRNRYPIMETGLILQLAELVGIGHQEVLDAVVVLLESRDYNRYKSANFLAKDLLFYRAVIRGDADWASWDARGKLQETKVLESKLLDENLVAKMANTERIDQKIIHLAEQRKDGCVTARGLKQDAELATLVKDCYPKYLNERLASLTQHGTFVKVDKGVYKLVE
ncbi:MAG: hypothetical protein ACE5R6_06295 [Candidatus Heimdallarchaeota archaeon]